MTEAWAQIAHQQGVAVAVSVAFIVVATFIIRSTSARSDRVFDAGLEIMRQMVARVVSGDGNGGPSLKSLEEKLGRAIAQVESTGRQVATLKLQVDGQGEKIDELTRRIDTLPGCKADGDNGV